MTTIAFKDDIIAFDSQITGGNTLSGYCNDKVKKIDFPDKTIYVGTAGSAALCTALMNWAYTNFDPTQKPKAESSNDVLQAFIIDDKGNVLHVDAGMTPYAVKAPFHTLGCGGDIALGAMAQGASALEAVKIAAKWDVNTGGKIHHFKLKFKEK